MRVRALVLWLALATACASPVPAPPTGPRLAIVPGRLARWPVSGGCEVVEWTAPSGRSTQVCLEPARTVEIRAGDVSGFRIEDRRVGEETWYVVSVLLVDEFYATTLRKLGTALPAAAHRTVPDPNDPDFFPGCDTPYAVLVDGQPSVVLPLRTMARIRHADLIVAATRDLSSAEATAAAWALPVTRVIAAEIAAQPVQSVALEDLIAHATTLVGKRVSVRGFYAGNRLFVREPSDLLDAPAAVFVESPSGAEGAGMCEGDYGSEHERVITSPPVSYPACQAQWVQVDAFVDATRGGTPELTRIDRIAWNGADCRRLPHPN